MVRLENVKVTGYEGTSLIRAWSKDVKATVTELDWDLTGRDLLIYTKEKFVCQAI